MVEGVDPTPAQIEAEFPAWRVFHGVNLMWYAQRDIARTSPPVVLRDENLTELRAAVASWERMHAPEAGRMPG